MTKPSQHAVHTPGVPNLPRRFTPQQVIEVMEDRYTAKTYNPDLPVSDEDFEAIMHAGRLSASSMGFEPWHFLHIADEKLIDALLPHIWGGQGKIEDSSHLVILLGREPDQMRPYSDYLSHIHHDVQHYPAEGLPARMERYTSFVSKDMALATPDQQRMWVDKQVYIALASMLTMSALLGVDSTPIEGFNYAAVTSVLADAGVLNTEEFHVAVMVCFGHSDAEHRTKTRRPLEEVLTVVRPD